MLSFLLLRIINATNNCDEPELNDDFVECKTEVERDYATCLTVCGSDDLVCQAGCVRFYTGEYNQCPCQPGCPNGCPCPSFCVASTRGVHVFTLLNTVIKVFSPDESDNSRNNNGGSG